MTEQSEKWIEALKQFESNSNAKVLCPECGTGYLKLQIESSEKEKKNNWYLICDSCKKYNVATKKIDN